MTRLSSLQIPLGIVLISSIALLISIIALLNNILYDFVAQEFWCFLIVLILSVAGFIVVGRTSVLYYDKQNLIIKRFNRKEEILLDEIAKLYLQMGYHKIAVSGFHNYYYRLEIVFKPFVRRESIFLMVASNDLEKFQEMLENR